MRRLVPNTVMPRCPSPPRYVASACAYAALEREAINRAHETRDGANAAASLLRHVSLGMSNATLSAPVQHPRHRRDRDPALNGGGS